MKHREEHNYRYFWHFQQLLEKYFKIAAYSSNNKRTNLQKKKVIRFHESGISG